MTCDLCDEENCKKPIQYAHKPYVFHFYHATQYEEAVAEFQPSNEVPPELEHIIGDSESEEDLVDNQSIEDEDVLADDEKDDESDYEEKDEEELINIFRKDEEEVFLDDHKEYEGEKEMLRDNRRYDEEEIKIDHEGVLQGEYKEDIFSKYLDDDKEYEEEKDILGDNQEYDEGEFNGDHEGVLPGEYEEDILEKYEKELVADDIEGSSEEVLEITDQEEEQNFPGRDEDVNEDFQEEISDDQEIQQETHKDSMADPAIIALANDAKSIIGITLDITMAAGVGIMAAIAVVATGQDHSQSASLLGNLESLTKTCIGVTLAGIGLVAAVKEIINAATEKAPSLPICTLCNKPELEQPGCQSFCSICGGCDEDSCWKDGTVDKHCLRICHDCNTNCVVCEKNVATVKKHHEAFSRNVHGKLSTHLHGTFKNIRMLGSSLIIAGIITCVIPGISWTWSAGLIAGSLIANSGIRIIAKPTVRIKCKLCELEEDPDKFEASDGCQKWCICCGVRGDSNENFCLALCEDCSK